MFNEMKDTRAMVNCVTFTYLSRDHWSLDEEKKLVKTSKGNKYREKLVAFAKKHHWHIYNINGQPAFYQDEWGENSGYYAYFKYQPITKKIYREVLENLDDPFFDFPYWGYGRRMVV